MEERRVCTRERQRNRGKYRGERESESRYLPTRISLQTESTLRSALAISRVGSTLVHDRLEKFWPCLAEQTRVALR